MKALASSVRKLREDTRASSAIEFAVIGSILIITTLGSFELARIVYTYHKLTSSLGMTTRMLQVNPASTQVEISNSIEARFTPAERSLLKIAVNLSFQVDGVAYTRIEATYDLPLVLPGLGLFSETSSFPVRAVHIVPTS